MMRRLLLLILLASLLPDIAGAVSFTRGWDPVSERCSVTGMAMSPFFGHVPNFNENPQFDVAARGWSFMSQHTLPYSIPPPSRPVLWPAR